MKPSPYDATEVHPCVNVGDGQLETCNRDDPGIICWSLYGHLPGLGLECISDHATEREARKAARKIDRKIATTQHLKP